MNKRIENLFEQALDEAVPETWTRLDMDQVKRLCDKFAELILKDATGELLDHRFDRPDEFWMDKQNDGIDFCLDAIRTHFGIEK